MKRVVIVIGPSGAGKSTVGERLASSLGWPFVEGDALHPEHNVRKMRAGIPLTDADRAPWLDALRDLIRTHLDDGVPVVIACSALKRAYRDRLRVDTEHVHFVYLQAGRALLRERLMQRKGHFMAADMLESQLEALEAPARAVTVDAARSVDDIVTELAERFRR
jgi:gluconokinase